MKVIDNNGNETINISRIKIKNGIAVTYDKHNNFLQNFDLNIGEISYIIEM